MTQENTATLAPLAACVRVVVAPSRVVKGMRSEIGHALIWAAFRAQADGMRRAARRGGR